MPRLTLPKSFPAFILTQSLGAFNDNFYRMLLQLYVLQVLLVDNAESIISDATIYFTLPFVIFGPWSGYLADRYSKSTVMKVVKFAEIGVMSLGLVAFYTGSVDLLLAVLFLMATQSTFFSPAKYGYLPEACSLESLTRANSWVEMSTFVSIIFGTAITGFLLSFHGNDEVVVALYCIGFAMAGSLTVLGIRRVPPAGTSEPFPWNPVTGIARDLAFLVRSKPLFLAALANSYFWMLGLIFQTNIVLYGKNLLAGTDPAQSNYLLSIFPAFLGIGIAAGSMLASRWSGQKVELGLVPLGGLGMAAAGILLYIVDGSYTAASIILLFGGGCGGLFIVPLYAYLQFHAPEREKGRVLATTGILNGIFLVIGSFLYKLLVVQMALSPAAIYLIMGIATIFAVVYICTVIPEYLVRFCFWLLTHTIYRIRIQGEEFMPQQGGALLAPNHVTYIDSFFIGATMQRFIRFVMLRDYYDIKLFRWLFILMKAIPIDPKAGRQAVSASLNAARSAVREGHVVCIYPEGQLTRNGELNTFRRGLETVMKELTCPIIPVYLENAWGSVFSWKGGRVFRRWPDQLLRRITVIYGPHLPADASAAEVQAAVQRLRPLSVEI